MAFCERPDEFNSVLNVFWTSSIERGRGRPRGSRATNLP
jgi:hypothetical protein